MAEGEQEGWSMAEESEKSLRRMVQVAEVFPDSEIVVSLVRQLSWTHILALLPLKDPLRRESTLKCAVAPFTAAAGWANMAIFMAMR